MSENSIVREHVESRVVRGVALNNTNFVRGASD